MKIAYFVNQYPAVSHSFIRREIQALEKLGIDVLRIALRVDESKIVDSEDKLELARTRYLLSLHPLQMLKLLGALMLTKPANFFSIAFHAICLGYRSERGVLRHIAYFIEAVVLNRWLQEAGVKHVHAHFGTNSTTIAMLASMLGNCQYSFTVHGPEEFDKPAFIHLPEKIERAKFVVAITSFCRSQLYRLVPSDQWGKIEVVRCGLDSLFLKNADVEDDRDPPEDLFVCVGRLCEQKGQLLLLDAMNDVIKNGHSMKLILAGDGPMREEIDSKIAHYSLEDRVEITGWISGDEVKKYISRSKAMVLPSFAEGLPVVIMEALAMKKPVITTYIAGIPELVENEVDGWLVPAGSRGDLVNALTKAIQASPGVCRKMGESGYGKVSEYHDITKESERLALQFEEAAS